MTGTTPIQFDELREGQLFQIGRELYQVSTAPRDYDVADAERGASNHLAAQWVYPVQSRTRVVTITRATYDARAEIPTAAMISRYETAWGFAKGSTK